MADIEQIENEKIIDKELQMIEDENENFQPRDRRHTDQSIEALKLLIIEANKYQNNQIDFLTKSVDNMRSQMEEDRNRAGQPFQILADMQRDMRDMKEDIESIKKNQCTPERRHECEEAFTKKKEWKDNWKKYRWSILFSTLAIFTVFFSNLPKYINDFLHRLFGGNTP